jgi:hypothetical protein
VVPIDLLQVGAHEFDAALVVGKGLGSELGDEADILGEAAAEVVESAPGPRSGIPAMVVVAIGTTSP